MKTLLFTDFQLTLIGLGAVALLIIAIRLFMRWEARHATTMYQKINKKNGTTL